MHINKKNLRSIQVIIQFFILIDLKKDNHIYICSNENRESPYFHSNKYPVLFVVSYSQQSNFDFKLHFDFYYY